MCVCVQDRDDVKAGLVSEAAAQGITPLYVSYSSQAVYDCAQAVYCPGSISILQPAPRARPTTAGRQVPLTAGVTHCCQAHVCDAYTANMSSLALMVMVIFWSCRSPTRSQPMQQIWPRATHVRLTVMLSCHAPGLSSDGGSCVTRMIQSSRVRQMMQQCYPVGWMGIGPSATYQGVLPTLLLSSPFCRSHPIFVPLTHPPPLPPTGRTSLTCPWTLPQHVQCTTRHSPR
jgi:hypothetical protein